MINEFISLVKTRGLARSNRFSIIIPVPFGDSNQESLIRLFCEATQLPGMQIETAPQRFWGETRYLPYDRTYDTVNLTFYLDTNMEAKRVFDQWFSLIQNPKTKTLNYYNNYIQDVTIEVLELESDSVIYEVKLFEAFPRSVTSIQMDAASKEVMKLSVTLGYKYYTTTAIDNMYKPDDSTEFIRTQDQMSTSIGEGYTTAISSNDFPIPPIHVSQEPKPVKSKRLTNQGGNEGI